MPFDSEIQTKEQRREAFIACHRNFVLTLTRKAKSHRVWRRELDATNRGAGVFYPEHTELLARQLAYHRGHMRRVQAERRAERRAS